MGFGDYVVVLAINHDRGFRGFADAKIGVLLQAGAAQNILTLKTKYSSGLSGLSHLA